MNLFELGQKHNCVKTYDRFKYSWAFCKEIYPEHFGHRRYSTQSLLEIGVHQGGSLRMWEEYFPHAQIYGVDIVKGFEPDGRVYFCQGSQSDATFLSDVSKEVDGWDIIIDDGSHKFEDQKISFETLWGELNSGGVYVIEDVMARHAKSLPCFDYFAELAKNELGKLTNDGDTDTHTDINRIVFYPKMIVLEKKI